MTTSGVDERAAVRLSGLRNRRRSLAEVLSDALARELVLAGEAAPGSLLPGEKELADRYGVSRPTVREALLLLQHNGLVAMRHGVGTVILPRSRTLTNGLDRLGSVELFAQEAGRRIETEDLEWEVVEATAEMAGRLQIPVEHPVLVVRRVKSLDGTRVGWIHDHIPEGVLAFDLLRSEFDGSTLDVILDHPEVGAEYGDSDIEPVALSGETAATLEVDDGSVALYIDTVVWTMDGRAVDWGRCWYLPEFFRFSVRRRHMIGRRDPVDDERLAPRRSG